MPLGLRAAQKSVELVADMPATVPSHLVGDPCRLRQVLINLLGNAIKFTERGEVALDIRSVAGENGHVRMRFGVTDTGIGIAPEKQSAIFSPFVQADGSTTRRFGGTGLGLAISSGLVEQMGGKIQVESAPGRGSRFEFTITLDRVNGLTQLAPPAPPGKLNGLRALVVDDNATNRRVLEEMTRHWGMRPTCVDGARAALDALAQAGQAGAAIDVVLLDEMMPEMDGFMMLEDLAKRPPMPRPIVVMLSSAGQAIDAERGRRLGVAASLAKPITQAALMKTLLTALGQAGASAARVQHGKTDRALRILMAEDNAVNQMVARNFLTQRGHTLVVANDGMEVVAAAEAGIYDIILMDIQMPVMDGMEAAERIRAFEREHGRARTPIVALTARAMREDRERYREAGMEGFVSKPFSRAELLSVVEKLAYPAMGYADTANNGHTR